MMFAKERRLPDSGGATMSMTTLHITPAGGEWAVKNDETAGVASVHPTQAQAVASAWEQLRDLDEAEVIVHDTDGRVRSSLMIRQVGPPEADAEEADLRRRAQEVMPGVESLLRLARTPSAVGADLDADPADLY
jgi:Uncharacterized protein conserved in bacteria (DUF2188)